MESRFDETAAVETLSDKEIEVLRAINLGLL